MPLKGTKAQPRDAAVVSADKTAKGMKKTKKKQVVSKRQRRSY